jgi:hypothetical protein
MAEKSLEARIQRKLRCYVRRARSETVHEIFPDGSVWRGSVAVFELVDHPEADIAYVWEHFELGRKKIVIALKIPPVDSAKAAVRLNIAPETG